MLVHRRINTGVSCKNRLTAYSTVSVVVVVAIVVVVVVVLPSLPAGIGSATVSRGRAWSRESRLKADMTVACLYYCTVLYCTVLGLIDRYISI
jgi:hypothetical protein